MTTNEPPDDAVLDAGGESRYGDDELRQMGARLRAAEVGKKPNGRRIVVKQDSARPDRVGEFAVRGTLGIVALYHRDGRPMLRTFLTLCHELGHARSWLQDERTPEYETAYPTTPLSRLDDASKRLVLEEETRAWRYGFELAVSVGFDDRASFLQEARRALGWYYDALGIPSPDSETVFSLPSPTSVS
jgi:hypothetical protein